MSIQEENTRQLSRLVKQQEETISKLKAKLAKAERTLGHAGYTDLGGELWRPPLGKSIKPMLEENATLRKGILNHQGVVQSFTDSLTKANETISKLKDLVKSGYAEGVLDGHVYGEFADEWDPSDTKSELEEL